MSYIRREVWGRTVYDPDSDEFEAHVCDEEVFVLDKPISAGCLVTGRCNLECGFCYGNHEALSKIELTPSAWASAFRHLSSWGLMRVDLSGGEPTLRKDLPEIAQSALDVGLNVVVSTNGLVLCKAGPGRLPREVRFHVSIDSGFAEIHESSRRGKNSRPSPMALSKALEFIGRCIEAGYRVRVLTCVGSHNYQGLFELGETLALHQVREWNVSRILPAGRALSMFGERWSCPEDALVAQINDMREAYPWLRIRYSNRTAQNGYFLLVLPDGTLATQVTDCRDKVRLGNLIEMSLADLRGHSAFELREHARKWLSGSLYCQDNSCPKCYSASASSVKYAA